ncbi:MAG: redoxin domain-containing protein [Isosphaeraceae bacterium]|nr:redoxin domain-containing protein [Isosphaeraceae bacterium]
MADFALRDVVSGQTVALADFAGRPAVVVAFLGIDCPIAELYAPRLAALSRDYESRGVAFLGVNANAHDAVEEIAAHAQRLHIPFPVLRDEGNVLADRLKADRMCEIVVLDGRKMVRYRGAIDDQYQIGARRDEPERHYLADALEAILAGRRVAVAESEVFGCPIERVKPQAPRRRMTGGAPGASLAQESPEEVGPVTYAEHVAPIVQSKCQDCHRPGEAGPFPLLTYEHVRRRASTLREAVDERRMPPWYADPRYGHFANDRSLSARERATLLAWVDQGTPRGADATMPPPHTFPQGWKIGTPDAVVSMLESYSVQAEGVVPYQRFRIPTGFTEDKWVQAVEGRPGDRNVVHHISIFIESHDSDRNNTHRTGPCLVTYAPGDIPGIYPPGVAKRIPAGSDLLFEVHYTPIGRERTDRSSVGLIFAKGPVRYEAITKGIPPPGPPDKRLEIPPGAENHEVRAAFTFRSDSHLIGMMPHMHLRGKDFQYTLRLPDGTSEILLSVPAFNFAWQDIYRFPEPRRLPKGARIECIAHYDNSRNNPANPDPTATVRWGDYTWDEMMIGYIDYYIDVLPKDGLKIGEDF